jgi:hypothetical protein
MVLVLCDGIVVEEGVAADVLHFLNELNALSEEGCYELINLLYF